MGLGSKSTVLLLLQASCSAAVPASTHMVQQPGIRCIAISCALACNTRGPLPSQQMLMRVTAAATTGQAF